MGALYATNIAGYSPFGMEGWRVAFRSVAVAAFVIGFVVLNCVVDPRHKSKARVERRALPPASHPRRDSRSDSRSAAVAPDVKDEGWQEVIADFWAVCRSDHPFMHLLQCKARYF